MYPLKLKYYAKTALWGGNTLKYQWNKTCDFDKLAETWELTVRPEATNIILGGALDGHTLGELLEVLTEYMVPEESGNNGYFKLPRRKK